MKNHIGESYISRMGEKYTIIAYNGTKDVTVQFEDGTIVEHRTYSHCKNAHIGNPNNPSKYTSERIGKTKKMLNGLNATIIKIVEDGGKTLKVLVRFEDGFERVCCYTSFMRGQVKHPNVSVQTLSNRVGMTVYQKYAKQNATVIEYTKSHNFTVKFEDGTVISSTIWDNFVKGRLQINKRSINVFKPGDRFQNNQGDWFTIIKYERSDKILVRFDNGLERWTSSKCIKNNRILSYLTINKRTCLGKKDISLCGLQFEIIGYKNKQHIDIQFEDGTKTYVNSNCLRQRRVRHPIFRLTSSPNYPITYKGLTMYFAFKTDKNVYFKTNELGIMEVHELINYTCQ